MAALRVAVPAPRKSRTSPAKPFVRTIFVAATPDTSKIAEDVADVPAAIPTVSIPVSTRVAFVSLSVEVLTNVTFRLSEGPVASAKLKVSVPEYSSTVPPATLPSCRAVPAAMFLRVTIWPFSTAIVLTPTRPVASTVEAAVAVVRTTVSTPEVNNLPVVDVDETANPFVKYSTLSVVAFVEPLIVSLLPKSLSVPVDAPASTWMLIAPPRPEASKDVSFCPSI